MAGTYKVDDSGNRALRKIYGPRELDRVFLQSARAGAKAAESIMRPAAPIGRSPRLSQFYRREGLSHGAFARTVKARRIRKRGIQARTIGFVIGPAGRDAFTRHWIAGGTRPHAIRLPRGATVSHPGQRANPWVERVASTANMAAARASDAVIVRHVNSVPRG